jgi:predicted type IV restriction endonuclease
VVADVLQDVFGYNKYTEITSEYAIHGTYCDLAIIDNRKNVRFLIEVKAISVSLNDNHLKQVVDYCANSGVNWAILTNAEKWFVYKIKFGRPIDKELVCEFNLLTMSTASEKDMDALFIISKEGQGVSAIESYYSHIQIKNKFIIEQILNSPPVFGFVKKTMKNLFADIKITDTEIADIMANDIIKREIIDSDESKKAKKNIDLMLKKSRKEKAAP